MAIEGTHRPTALEHTLVRLTREEFQVVYAIQWLEEFEEYRGEVPLEAFRTVGMEKHIDPTTGALPYVEHLWRAIRFLHHRCHYQFEGLDVKDDLRIIAKPAVELRNILYDQGLALNAIDIRQALKTLIRWVESGKISNLNPDLFRQVLDEVDWSVQQAQLDINPEQMEKIEQLYDALLAKVGVVRDTGLN